MSYELILAAAMKMYEASRPADTAGDETDDGFDDLSEEEMARWLESAEIAFEVFHQAYRRDKLGETRFLMNNDDATANMAKAAAKLDGQDFDKMPKKARVEALTRAKTLLNVAKVPPGLRPGQMIGYTMVYTDKDGSPVLGETGLSTTEHVTFYAGEYQEKLGVGAVYLLIEGPGVKDKIN